MQPDDSGDAAAWGLVLPFVVTASHDGPYDDQSFVAGWQAGRADTELRIAAAVGARSAGFQVYTDLVRQVELSAMSHGYPHVVATPLEGMPEWSWVAVAKGPSDAGG